MAAGIWEPNRMALNVFPITAFIMSLSSFVWTHSTLDFMLWQERLLVFLSSHIF